MDKMLRAEDISVASQGLIHISAVQEQVLDGRAEVRLVSDGGHQ